MFEKLGKELGNNIIQASKTLSDTSPKIGAELGDKILKSSENLKEASKENSRGLIIFGALIKEALVYSSLIVVGGLILNNLLSTTKEK